MLSSIENLVYELRRELPNNLRLRTLGNNEILGKSQKEPFREEVGKLQYGNPAAVHCQSHKFR